MTLDLILKVFHSQEKDIRAPAIIPTLAIIESLGQATIDDIRSQLKLCERTAHRALLTLTRAGFLTVEHRSTGFYGRKKSIYRIEL